MKKASVILCILIGLFSLQSCYKIEPYFPDPDKIYVPGKRIKPRVEKEFVQNPSLRVQLGTIVVLDLEHLNSPGTLGPDTDVIGTDEIRYNVEDSTNLVFRPDEAPTYVIEFFNEALDILYFYIDEGSEEVQVQLGPGKYRMKVTSKINHGADSVGYQVVFIQPAQVSQSKVGGVSGEPEYWFITSRSMACVGCDLAGLDLQAKYLVGVDLHKANLSDCNLSKSDLKTAKITYAKLNSVNLNSAEMRGINLSFSTMRGADLRLADLSYSILNATNLSTSRAQGANFCFATKNGWVIDGVIVDALTECFP